MRKTAALIFFAVFCPAGLYGQAVAGYGAITGMVIDPYGDGIPDTTVVISNDALAIRRVLNTSDDGVFDAPDLIPGKGYAFKVTRKGYTSWTTRDVEVLMGRTLNFTVNLRKQDRTTKKAEAESGAPVVDDSAASTYILLTPEEIAWLPISARLIDPLVLTAPFTSVNRQTGAIGFEGEGFSHAVLTDTIYTSNNFSPATPNIAPQISPDAVSEFTVISATPPAEFGHSAGGVVNLGMHTGSNALHGSVYDYYNPVGLNAHPRFAPSFDPKLKANHGGASAGGAILRNRVFAFANLEADTSSSNALNRITNPLIANSTFTGVAPSACTTTAAPCAAALAFLNPQFNAVVPRSDHSERGFLRVDYARGENDRFSVEANALHRNAPNSLVPDEIASDGGLLGTNGNIGDEERYAKANWNRIVFSNLFNEANVSWYRDRISDQIDKTLLPSTGLLGLTVDGTSFGANTAAPSVVSEQRGEIVDHLVLTSYSHTLLFGVDYSKNQDWIYGRQAASGLYDYTTLTNFANDFSGNTRALKNYDDFQQGLGNLTSDMKWGEISGIFQDTWKATPSLTIIPGVRYEKTHTPYPPVASTNANYYLTCCIPSPNTSFSPRVGITYMFNDRLVLRAGFGFYYQPYYAELLNALYNGNGITQPYLWINSTQTGAPVFPGVIPSTASIPGSTNNLAYAATKFRNPYTEQLNLSLEHELNPNTTVTLTALEVRGEKLWDALDTNLQGITPVSKNYIIQNSGGQTVSTYPDLIYNGRDGVYAHIWQVQNEGESRYTAGFVQLRQRMWHSLTTQLSAGWSKATDDVSGPPVVGGVPASTFPGNFRGDQGNSDFDQRWRGTLSFVYAPRFVGQDSPMRWIVNGWQISGIATVASTMWATPTILVNGQQFAGTTMPFPTSLNGTGGNNRVPFDAPNSLPIGSMHTLDARFSREFEVNDRVRVVALIEGFNVLNSQYTTSVNTLQYVATGGALRPVPNFGQANEAFGFPFGSNARRAEFGFKIVF